MNPFTFNTPPSILCQAGAVSHLAEICHARKILRPLIVTDPGIVKLGMLSQIEEMLTAAGLVSESFTEVVADPPEAVVHAAIRKAAAFQADGIIGFGGGSSMDTAKLVALIAKSGEQLSHDWSGCHGACDRSVHQPAQKESVFGYAGERGPPLDGGKH